MIFGARLPIAIGVFLLSCSASSAACPGDLANRSLEYMQKFKAVLAESVEIIQKHETENWMQEYCHKLEEGEFYLTKYVAVQDACDRAELYVDALDMLRNYKTEFIPDFCR